MMSVITGNMDTITSYFDEILIVKSEELKQLYVQKSEKRKMTHMNNDIDYHSKTTLNSIEKEKDRKLKSSKNYKKTQAYGNV